MAQGNPNVILCERGIRTFENADPQHARRQRRCRSCRSCRHLPVFVDPSHAAGKRAVRPALSLAGVAAGADGLMIEVHPSPDHALSDGAQSLKFDEFDELVPRIAAVAHAVGRSLPVAAEMATVPA